MDSFENLEEEVKDVMLELIGSCSYGEMLGTPAAQALMMMLYSLSRITHSAISIWRYAIEITERHRSRP